MITWETERKTATQHQPAQFSQSLSQYLGQVKALAYCVQRSRFNPQYKKKKERKSQHTS